MTLTKQDIEHVAKLARLALTDAETEKFTAQLDGILGYINKLSEVDTQNIAPMLHSLDSGNVLRADLNLASTDHAQIMKNAPEQENRFFKVKKVIE